MVVSYQKNSYKELKLCIIRPAPDWPIDDHLIDSVLFEFNPVTYCINNKSPIPYCAMVNDHQFRKNRMATNMKNEFNQ